MSYADAHDGGSIGAPRIYQRAHKLAYALEHVAGNRARGIATLSEADIVRALGAPMIQVLRDVAAGSATSFSVRVDA